MAPGGETQSGENGVSSTMADLDLEDSDPGYPGPIDSIHLVDWYPDVVGAKNESVAIGQVHRVVPMPASLNLARPACDEIIYAVGGTDISQSLPKTGCGLDPERMFGLRLALTERPDGQRFEGKIHSAGVQRLLRWPFHDLRR